MWHAFHETLGHWLYWIIALAIVFSLISYFAQRDHRNNEGDRK